MRNQIKFHVYFLKQWPLQSWCICWRWIWKGLVIEVTLCFLGATGAGGVLYDSGGNKKLLYAWNISISTNNQAEAYTLLHELKLEKGLSIPNLMVTWVSKLIIKHARFRSNSNIIHLRGFIGIIHMKTQTFNFIGFFHVLRIKNQEANSLANQALRLQDGTLLVNGTQYFENIPWIEKRKSSSPPRNPQGSSLQRSRHVSLSP